MDYKYYSKEELLSKIQNNTYLLGDRNINPYKNAKISIQTFSYKDLIPSAYYYFYEYVYNLTLMYKDFLIQGIDITALDGYISFFNKEYNKQLALTPPIIERIDNVNMILDGMHRIVMAKNLSKDINCILIENSDINYLPYAVPNKDGWKNVNVFKNKIPEGFKTRDRRYPENNKFYARCFLLDGETQIPREHSLKIDDYYKKLIEQDLIIKSKMNTK